MTAPPGKLVVIGAGPAGLTAAFEARRAGFAVIVLEKDPRYVGGIARTVEYKGFRFDIGGHRFFSKSEEITRWWKERLPDDFIRVKRMSRILYRGKFFDYPLRPWNALSNLGLLTSIGCIASYAWARVFPRRPETTFEDWVSNRFGRKLFRIFFQTYTEKVWGIPTSQLSADWAAQRIKGLSLLSAIRAAVLPGPPAGSDAVIKTLIDTFEYPRLGPGQMWETTAAELIRNGGQIAMGMNVTRIGHENGRVVFVEAADSSGAVRRFEGDHFIVSMPLRETVLAFDPPLPEEAVRAAQGLAYRDFITVALIIDGPNPFADNWIYIHDPAVKVGRIQNFRNWSAALVGESNATCLGLEYFCFAGDGLWTMADTELVALAGREVGRLGLAEPGRIRDGAVVRMEKAYPIYTPDYQAHLRVIRSALERDAANLQVVGRNGMHKYNNQDHSMMTSLLAVKNLRDGAFNLWNVNSDAEYHEEVRGEDQTGRRTPQRTAAD